MKNNYVSSYQNSNPYYTNTYSYNYPLSNSNDERLVGGGFLGPFILGGITGGLVSPFFYGGYNNNRPPVYYYQPGPYRPPYYAPGPYRPY